MWSAGFCWKANPFIFRMFLLIRSTHYVKPQKLAGYRTSLGVPLLREGSPIGLLVLQRATVRPFTGKEIELAETFAAQAVIAIENTRLLNELRQRTTTYRVARAADSDLGSLKVSPASPGDLEPVFQTMLENATRICEANFGSYAVYDGESITRGIYITYLSIREFYEKHGPIPRPEH